MAIISNTLEEELAERGILGSYIWKPNRIYAKDGDTYTAVDVISDGTAEQATRAIREAGENQVSAINALAREQTDVLNVLEQNYANYKNNLIQTYTRLLNYFQTHDMKALETIMNTAIVNLNSLD